MAPKPQVKDDPNTFIPPAVRKMAQQADAAFRAQHGQPPEQPVPPEPPPPEQAAPPVTPEPPPPEQAAPPAAPRVTFPASAEPPSPLVPPVTPEVTEESWKQRHDSMLGRYKRAENDILSMSAQIASMQSLIASMQKPPSETPAELRPQSLLTPEEVNEYGQEFLGVVARRAKEELTPEVASLRSELTSLKQQWEGAREQQNTKARYDMEASLDTKLPHWRDINVMPEFHAWLALPDMFSGAIKHDLLRAAYAQNNSPRVLSFFKGFLDQEAAYVPQGGETRQADVLQNGGKVSLESLAAPGRAKTSAASTAPVEKPIITRAQISQFYADSASGKYRGREADKNQLEAMIFEAEREGRIR